MINKKDKMDKAIREIINEAEWSQLSRRRGSESRREWYVAEIDGRETTLSKTWMLLNGEWIEDPWEIYCHPETMWINAEETIKYDHPPHPKAHHIYQLAKRRLNASKGNERRGE